MPTILELAQHADLPAETVLRVILREPTSEVSQRAVADAVAALGPPDYPRPNGNVEVLPDEHEPQTDVPVPAAPPAQTLDQAVLEQVQNLVEPATEQVVQLRALFQEVVRRLKAERRERVEDLELVTELIIEGWRGVDQRLGRIEKIMARLEEAQAAQSAGRPRTVVRLEDWVKQPFGETESGSDRS